MAPMLSVRNMIGVNTATSTAVVAMTANATCRDPRYAATSGDSPSSMRRWMFSSTTMASSTTRPMDSTSASRVMRLTVKPNAARAMKADTRHTGIVTAGMAMVRSDPRNTRITRLTNTVVTAIVRYTELMAARMNTESSEPVDSRM